MKNTFVKVLSLLMALMMAVGVFGTISFAAECDHTKGEYIDGKAPTCQTPGFSRYICGLCGEEWITDIIQASDEYHNVEEVPAISASCLTAGYSAGRRCTVPGCTEIAEGCEQVADAKPHTFVGKEVAPTCFDKGWVVYTCTSCGYTAEQLSGNAEFGVDFDGDGVKDNKFLAGQTYEDWQKVETGKAQLTHKYDWTIVTAPVNTNGVCSDGLAKGVCANCKDAQTTVIPVEHNYVKINPDNLPCIEWNDVAEWCANCKKIRPGYENEKHDTTGHTAETEYEGVFNPADDDFAEYIADGEFTLSDLYDLKFELGDLLYKDASCTEAGYQLIKCSCGELLKQPIAPKDHNWSEWSAYSTPTFCDEPSVKTRTCLRNCGVPDQVSEYAPAASSAHSYNYDVTAPTCTEMGYTTTTCTNTITINGQTTQCAYSKVDTWVDAQGHDWGEAYLASGSCDNGTWDKACTREDCDATYVATVGQAVTPTDAQKTHTWGDAVPVAGTCHEKSYTYKQCTKCEYYFVNDTTVSATLTDDAKLRTENDKLDAANHEYVFDRWAVSTPADCTVASAVAIFKCQYCDVDGSTEITRTVNNPVAHTPVNGYVTGSGNNKVGHSGGRAATCKTIGYEADGSYCSVCLVVLTKPTEIAINPNNHEDTPDEDNKLGAFVAATCQSDAYQKHYLTCCQEITIYSVGTKKADCTEGYVTVPYDAAECLTNGNHEYIKCQWCGTIKPDSVDTTGCTQCSAAEHEAAKFANNPVIPATGHKFPENNNVDEVIENHGTTNGYNRCDDTIVLAHKNCVNPNCDYVEFNGTVYKSNTDADFLAVARQLPHYNKYMKHFDDKDSSCTSAGIVGGDYCTVCQKDAWIDPIDEHVFSGTDENKVFTVNYANSAVVNCVLDACIVIECDTCTAKHTEYIYKVDGEHNWTEWADVPFTGYSCTDDHMQERHCLDCATGVTAEERVKENGGKTGCYTTKGVLNGQKYPISYDCDKIAEFIGWQCDVCGNVVEVADVQHNVGDPVEKAPTCTEDGYTIKYCTGCGLTEKADSVAFYEPIYVVVPTDDLDYDHDMVNGIILEDNNSYTKYICGDCGETVTKNKPAPAPQLTVTVNASADKVAAGETFTVTYALSGKTHKFTALNLQVNIPANMTLVGIESARSDLYAVVASNGGISLIVPNDAEGKAQAITTEAAGTVLFTLTYTVNKTAASDDATVTITDKDGVLPAAADTVKITSVGNLNGDTVVTAADAQAIFGKVGTNDVASDVNCDGIVNLADVIALAKFAASAQTAADYLEMVGELDTLEAEVFALLESGKLNDVNEDKIVNITDAYALIARVNTAIATGYTKLGNMVTMEAVVAYLNVNENLPTLA